MATTHIVNIIVLIPSSNVRCNCFFHGVIWFGYQQERFQYQFTRILSPLFIKQFLFRPVSELPVLAQCVFTLACKPPGKCYEIVSQSRKGNCLLFLQGLPPIGPLSHSPTPNDPYISPRRQDTLRSTLGAISSVR